MQRLTRLFILGIFAVVWLGCAETPEPTAETSAPLYVDAIGGGHGPFACTGTIPERGYVDVFTGANYTGTCQRWRGDMADGSGYQHAGFSFWAQFAINSMRVSPLGSDQTAADVCEGWVALPYGCDTGHRRVWANADVPSFAFTPDQIRVQYTSYCPATASFTHLRQGTGTYATEDGSLLATVQITDNFGQPLFEPNGSSIAVDCVTYLTPGLMAQFTPPAGYKFGNEVVAVYAYP